MGSSSGGSVVDGTIASAFRPLPIGARRAVARLLGIDPAATALPADAAGRPRSAPRAVPPAGRDPRPRPPRRSVERGGRRGRCGRRRLHLQGADRPASHPCRGPEDRRPLRLRHRRHPHRGRAAGPDAGLVPGPRPRAGAALDAGGCGSHRREPWRRRRGRPTVRRRSPDCRPELPAGVAPGRGPAGPDRPPASRHRHRRRIGPIVLYQGGFSVDRGIEELVAALETPALAATDVVAVFIGYGRLKGWLDEQAARLPGRVIVVDAIPPAELQDYTVDADVGFVGQPPRTLNQRLNLANKLFEYLQTAVPVVVAEGHRPLPARSRARGRAVRRHRRPGGDRERDPRPDSKRRPTSGSVSASTPGRSRSSAIPGRSRGRTSSSCTGGSPRDR